MFHVACFLRLQLVSSSNNPNILIADIAASGQRKSDEVMPSTIDGVSQYEFLRAFPRISTMVYNSITSKDFGEKKMGDDLHVSCYYVDPNLNAYAISSAQGISFVGDCVLFVPHNSSLPYKWGRF